MQKASKLQSLLKKLGSVLVAYSGGVDSTFLLKACRDALGDKAVAVTAVSETYPQEELACAKACATALGVRHRVIRTHELKDPRFSANPENRCYYCKRELFCALKALARRQGIAYVVEASTVSDSTDYRPGSKAKKEAGVRSPLVEAGFTKEEIRTLSRRWGLPTWNKPSLACLASRVPYGRKLTVGLLRKIEAAEEILWKKGFTQVRVRDHGNLCRIEVLPAELRKAMKCRVFLIEQLRKLGYTYVTVDLQGYRTGSLNEVITHEKNLS